MPIIPPVVDEHGQHHEAISVETFNHDVRLRVLKCRSSLCASQKGTQRFHKSILELPPLVAMNNQRHTKSQNNLLDQDIRHRVGTFILYRESFRPLTEIVSDHQDVAVAVRCRVTDVQNVHRNTIPVMTGRNISQQMMSSSWRLPLDAHDALAEPFFYIIRHPRPIEAMRQSCQCSITTQMTTKQRSMV